MSLLHNPLSTALRSIKIITEVGINFSKHFFLQWDGKRVGAHTWSEGCAVEIVALPLTSMLDCVQTNIFRSHWAERLP